MQHRGAGHAVEHVDGQGGVPLDLDPAVLRDAAVTTHQDVEAAAWLEVDGAGVDPVGAAGSEVEGQPAFAHSEAAAVVELASIRKIQPCPVRPGLLVHAFVEESEDERLVLGRVGMVTKVAACSGVQQAERCDERLAVFPVRAAEQVQFQGRPVAVTRG
ncbi:hypothetical protein OOT46_24710 [Aquabacterium sp. A7-Y]|uniref:hypothetical protein n=1 Tax=Aquabacterium sp. A7-Y TaxID=1349605 RepID=UPI00223CF32C|nr:hypothetical protein [Aquabacterium sp. A7-Y]MCW7541028.1 hypothetical protein [Aquabacterium sp. A7-Y]